MKRLIHQIEAKFAVSHFDDDAMSQHASEKSDSQAELSEGEALDAAEDVRLTA